MKNIRLWPSSEILRELFEYCDDATAEVGGFLMRGALLRKSTGRLVFGSITGRASSRAQVGIRIDGVSAVYVLNRTIWCWHHGDPGPEFLVDHEDNDHAHNRIGNLRLATPSGNQVNRKASRRGSSASKFIGVCGSGSGFNAFTAEAGKPIYLGKFDTEHEAARVRDVAVFAKHGTQAKLNRDLFPGEF